MAPNSNIEEPILTDDTLHYFMASLADLDQFSAQRCIKCLSGMHEEQCTDHIGWPTQGPIDHHLGKCCHDCNQRLMLAPRWEYLMATWERNGLPLPSAEEAWREGRLAGYQWTLIDVSRYHAAHTDELGWWTEEEANWAIQHYGKPVPGRIHQYGYRPWERDEI